MTAWITKLKAQALAAGNKADDTGEHKSFMQRISDAADTMVKQTDDPWAAILANLSGTVVGGIERIATFRVFELLGIPPRAQSSDIRRRLAKRMTELGWQPIRCHGLNERSFLTRVRGFSRVADHEGTPLLPPNTTKAGRRPQPLM